MTSRAYISSFGNLSPTIAADAFVDISARLIGDVRIEPKASIWPGAVLRADDDKIIIGKGSAILDLCLIEAPKKHPVIISEHVLISHMACIHGAVVNTGALVGIGSIILDGAIIGRNSLIGAGALIPPKMVVPENTLMLGQPAKPIREISHSERQHITDQLNDLIAKAEIYKKT